MWLSLYWIVFTSQLVSWPSHENNSSRLKLRSHLLIKVISSMLRRSGLNPAQKVKEITQRQAKRMFLVAIFQLLLEEYQPGLQTADGTIPAEQKQCLIY